MHMWVAGSERLNTRPAAHCESPPLRSMGTNSFDRRVTRRLPLHRGRCLPTAAVQNNVDHSRDGDEHLAKALEDLPSTPIKLSQRAVGVVTLPRVALGSSVHT